MDTSPHASGFVNANGVRLQYLDWGGTGPLDTSGPLLLFIPGMGCTAHIFEGFAPLFTDRFHVMAVTRRGNGESDAPESGYDADTLAEDLRKFLDALHIDQVILAGHSMGYLELSRFAHLYPERVQKLIWLDAAYDRNNPADQAMLARNPFPKMMPPWPDEPLHSIEAFAETIQRIYPSLAAIWGPEMEADLRANVTLSPEGIAVEKMTDAISSALTHTMNTYPADYAGIRVPMLAIFVLVGGSYFLADYLTAEQKAQVLDYFNNERHPFVKSYIEQFQRSVPHARVVVIPNGHHYCFIKQKEQVYQAMRAFLLEDPA